MTCGKAHKAMQQKYGIKEPINSDLGCKRPSTPATKGRAGAVSLWPSLPTINR